jgi:inorganic triphosphatase YgiF
VKLPAGDGARRELHFPPGRAGRTPPRAVLAPVRGLLRGAAVGPVATLRTARRATLLRDEAGRVLAEVADDSVTGTALAAQPEDPAAVLSWREVEVELVDGDDALLAAVGERLVAAGATPSASASKLGRVLRERLAALDGTASGEAADRAAGTGKKRKKGRPPAPAAGAVVLTAVSAELRALQAADVLVRTGSPAALHDLEIAGRRLSGTLAACRPVLDRRVTGPLREELRWLTGRLRAGEDGPTALAHLRGRVGELAPELVLGPVAARLQQAAVGEDAADRRAAERLLGDDRYLALLDGLSALLERPPLAEAADGAADEVLADALRRAGKRLRRRLERVAPDASAELLDEVREAVERVQGAAEAAGPVLGRRARALADCAAQVQAALDGHRLAVAAGGRCRGLGLAAFAAGENAWTYGLLHGLEQARAEQAVAGVRAVEDALADAVRRVAGGA